MNKNYLYGIGIVLAVLVAFTAPAMAGPNTVYFTNQSGDTSPSGISYLEIWLNLTDAEGVSGPDFGLSSLMVNFSFDPNIGDVIACDEPPAGHPWQYDWYSQGHWADDSWYFIASREWPDDPPYGLAPGIYQLANITIEGVSPGVMDLEFEIDHGSGPRYSDMIDVLAYSMPNQTWEKGTYHCGHVLNLPEFPMYEAEAVGDPADRNKGCGPAVAKMWLDYMHNSTTQWNDTHFGDMPAMNQAELYAWGRGNNSNTSHPYLDTQGMWYTVQYLDPGPYSEYGYNFGKYSSTDQDYMIKQICKWLDYAPGKKPGYPVHVPGAVPAYGNYENWMAIRGIHTNVSAYPLGGLEVYGFWVNDPYPTGVSGSGHSIGENSFKMVDDWKTTYYLPLDVPGEATYNGKYVGILEPPEDTGGEITIVPAKPRLTEAITPVLAEKTLMVYDVEQLALEKVVRDDEMLMIVAAAIDGVNEELAPYDAEFAEVFAKTVPGAPMLVSGDNGDYYIVPFNVPVIARPPVKVMPVKIEKIKTSGLKKLERVKRVDADVIVEPIPIEPIKVERTLVVVVVDAEDGSFKEASWVGDPVKYLPVSKTEALKLALGEIDITSSSKLSNLITKPVIELVYRDASPYYPDWKITVNGEVFYVSHDGTVSS